MASTIHKTASTHRSAVVRGTHEFHIVGCSGRKRFASAVNSSSIKSGSFLAGGHTWALACTLDDQGSLASITLELLGTTKDVVATAGIRIEDPLGEWPTAVWQSDAIRFQETRTWKLSVPETYHGHGTRYVRDDRLTIECTVDVLEEYSPGAADLHKLLLVDESAVSGSGSSCSENRRRHRMKSDVTFVVEETEIQAHKLVLAMRSPVFAAEFRWHAKLSSILTRLSVDDMSASTFRAMLRFIYTDEMPIKASNDTSSRRACKEKYALRRREAMARDLLVAADRYDLERLRIMCQNILLESLDASTVMGTLLLVRGRHTCCQLEDSCIEYIASDPNVYAAVRATDEYQELKNSCSPLIIEIMERVATHNPNGARKSSDGMKHRPPEKTWSTYNALVHSVHEFRIPNFCAVQRSVGVGQVIHSGTFNVGGYDWHVWMYPSGEKGEAQGNIALYLKLLSQPPVHGIVVSGKFFVGNPSGKFTTEKKEWIFTNTYTRTSLAWGYTKLMSFESAKSRYLANDGSLTICCSFAVTKQPYTTTSTPATRAMIVVPSSSIALYLDQLLVGGHGSDVQFLVEGSEICAHSLVIAARSPILYEEVAAAVSNKDGHIVRIDGMKATVFKAVIHFVYTDELPALGSTVVDEDMLAAASRFGLERMKIICENFLAEHISKENAVDTFNVARRHRCSKLEDYCIDFILSVPSLAKGLIKTIPLPSPQVDAGQSL
ncbi:uncharacterized protein LOC124664142 [Lolium rigidum]|uniref:uncharacterized protein LOC124664142 n=1 Tax=Lolium rigidum TaxID=89674 RepID=UPI001F5D7FBD|nr:uncharacterized protein LOC124664142 [Lolium rigidum]